MNFWLCLQSFQVVIFCSCLSPSGQQVFNDLRKFSKHPDFTPEKVETVSVACKSMCQWVLAVEHYHDVHKMAIPKQKKEAMAREALELAQENLLRKQARLEMVKKKIQI